MSELGFFQGHSSSPASFSELQKEHIHQGKIRQLVSHVQSKVKIKKALPEAEEKVYDSETKLSKENIKQLVGHVQSKVKIKKALPEAEEKEYDSETKLSKENIRQLVSKSKLTEDEYCKLPKLEASLIFGKQPALSLISKDTKNKGYIYIQFKVCTFRSILDDV